MSSAETASATTHCPSDPAIPIAPALLRGTSRGLEIVVNAGASADAVASAIIARLAEAPGFFRGSEVRVRVDGGSLAAGCLARLDGIAAHFELRIVEVFSCDAVAAPGTVAAGSAPVPLAPPAALGVSVEHAGAPESNQPSLPLIPPPVTYDKPPRPAPPPPAPPPAADEPTAEQLELALRALEPDIEIVEPDEPDEPAPEPPRIVIGPVRSGVILEHHGHLIIFGDVNPGAEVRAEGNIIVLGRLRGTAHAGIGAPAAFILALRLQPQQLRIGRTVARASDSDTPGTEPEIAHVTGATIVVERYTGKLPIGLAATI